MRTVFGDFEQAYIRVPGVEAGQFFDLDAVKFLDDGEQASQYLVDGEVGTQDFLGNAVALLAQFLAVVADIPALQLVAALLTGECLQFAQVLFGKWLAACAKVAEEVQHLIGAFSHFAGQAQLGVVAEAQQFGQFLTQG